MSLETAFNALVTKLQNNFTFLKNKIDTLISIVSTKVTQTDFTTHTGNTTAHITAQERSTWNSKQDALSASDLAKIASVPDKLDAVTASNTYATKSELTAIANSRLKREFVNALPAVTDAVENTLYMVPNNSSENSNIKDEYLFANGVFELMGTTEVDLSGYTPTSTFESLFTNASITDLSDGE